MGPANASALRVHRRLMRTLTEITIENTATDTIL
jgi:hypothetical protein